MGAAGAGAGAFLGLRVPLVLGAAEAFSLAATLLAAALDLGSMSSESPSESRVRSVALAGEF